MEKVVVIVKPDGVKRALTGEILARFEKVGLKLVGIKMVKPDRETVSRHYPNSRTELLEGIGNKTLKVYEEIGKDASEVFGTKDPLKIGQQINEWNKDYLTGDPVVAILLFGRHAVQNARNIAGATMPSAALPGTIRGDFATDSAAYANPEKRAVQNLVHVSGTPEEAGYEEDIWFSETEKHEYKRADEGLV